MQKKPSILLLLLLINVPAMLWAQQFPDTIRLENVVVHGTKPPIKNYSKTMSVSELSLDQIDVSGESSLLPILSEQVPGLFITERGITGFGLAGGSAGSISIRGIGSGNKVLMLFDGQAQWAGIFGHHLPDTYMASDIESVEIVRGPASLMYGSNAMAGAINMITRNASKEGVQMKGRLMYGSYNTQKYMFNLAFKKKKFDGMFSFNHDQTDGHRVNSDFSMDNAYAKLNYQIDPHWKASGDILAAKIRSTNPGTISDPKIESWVDAFRGTASLSLNNTYSTTEGSVKFFHNTGNHEVNDGWKNGLAPTYLFQSRDHNSGATAYQHFSPMEGSKLSLGMDYKQWGGRAWNDSIVGPDQQLVDKLVNEFAPYALIEQDLWQKINLNAGMRLEVNQSYGSEWVPQAGISYRIHPTARTIRGNISKGFRSPNIRELYMFAPANADLEPEVMMNYELSYVQTAFNEALDLELTAYFIEGKNMIQTLMVDGRPKNMNSGSFIHKGFESMLKYRFSKHLKVNANYSFLHKKKALVAAPKHQFFMGLNANIFNIDFMLNTQHINGLNLSTAADAKTVHYTLLNFKASYKIASKHSVFLKADNITNACYSINQGFPMPGANFMVGMDFLVNLSN